LPVYEQNGVWIAECPECGFRGEKDNEKSAEMLLVRHAALCPARKKEREKEAAGAVTARTGEEEVPQTFSELVEQVMADYGIRKEVIERVKRRVAHTNKYERDPVQFRRLLEGQRLKQSTVQMVVEDVFDEYVGRGAAEPYMGYDYAWRQHGMYGTPYHYGAPYPVPSPAGERVIERPLPSGGVERVIYVGPSGEREKDYSSLERRLDRIERMLDERRRDNPGGTTEVVVSEPIRDEQGRIIVDDDGKPIYRILRGSPNVVGGVTDFRDRLLERVVLEQTKSKAELTTEDIRKIIRDEIRTRETAPKETVSKDDLERFKKDTVESVKKIFEERETEGRLARIEKDLKDIKTGAVGQVSEEGRIRLTSIDRGIGAVEKQMENINRTITNVVNMIPKLLRPQTPEGTRIPTSEAEIEGVAERLEEKIAETGEAEKEVDFIA